MKMNAIYNYENLKILFILLVGINLTFAENDNQSFTIDYKEDSEPNALLYRLPTNYFPTSYNLVILPQLAINNFTYEGTVQIKFTVTEKTNQFILHTDKLTIFKEKTILYRTINESDTSISVHAQSIDKERQLYIINVLKNLELGEYTLILSFAGEIQDDLFGFYRSFYNDNTNKIYAAFTQFSPTYARRAFPCLDEPHFKANFTLTIGHYNNETVTSNMPVKNVIKTNRQSYVLTTFSTTPPLPAYLVGWAIHNFEVETNNDTLEFKMWSRGSMTHRGSYALRQGQRIYQALKDWFGVENNIVKMDQFAIPDFHFHAMENFGLITFRESVVLFDEESTPARYILDGLSTMAHEYTHSWFGNLVTPAFWDVAWLKEGFATYFQNFILTKAINLENAMDIFVVEDMLPTMLSDSFDHSRTLNGVNIGTPNSIMSAMDYITYKKGASIIRMMQHAMDNGWDSQNFQYSLKRYLSIMSNKAATPEDLYDAFQQYGMFLNRFKVKDIMNSWTTKPGYPLVTVIRNYTTKVVQVTQERFYMNREYMVNENSDDGWYIPLSLAIESIPQLFNQPRVMTWMRAQDKSRIMGILEIDDWLIFNVQQMGYFRVNYDETNWNRLIDFLINKNISTIHRINRASLIDDSFNLARAGYIDYSIPFNLTKYLVREDEYEPWVSAINNLKFLNFALSGKPETHRLLQIYVQNLLTPIYNKLDFNEAFTDNVATKLQRNLILSTSCLFNNNDCVVKSLSLFQSWLRSKNKTDVPPNYKSFVYCEGVRNGDEYTWDTMWERFKQADLQSEQELLLNALSCSRSQYSIDKLLKLPLSLDSGIRKQYHSTIYKSVLNSHPENVDHVLEFLQSDLTRIINIKGNTFLGDVIVSIGSVIRTDEQLEKLITFAKDNVDELSPVRGIVKKTLNLATINVRWIRDNLPVIAQYLS